MATYSSYDQAAAAAKASGGQAAYIDGKWTVVGAQQAMSAGPIGPTNWDEIQRNTMAGGMAAGSTRTPSRPPTAPTAPSRTGPVTSFNPWGEPGAYGTTPYQSAAPGGDQTLADLLAEFGIGGGETAMPGIQGGWDTPFPGGAVADQMVTLSDGSSGFWTRDALGWPKWNPLTPAIQPLDEVDQAQLDMMQQQMEMDWQQMEAQMAMQEAQLGMQQSQLTSEDAWRQSQIDLARDQYGAQLAAQPHSWLEYSAFTGETPVNQPWMTPLSPGDYPQLQAGQPIPGYSATDMTGMPELLRPSAQYQARIGPTAEQQYLGYEQGRTGAIPEETLWRQQSAAPPSGRFAGLSRRR